MGTVTDNTGDTVGNDAQKLSLLLAAAVEATAPSVWRVEGRRGATGVVWSETQILTVAAAVAGREEVRVIGPDGVAHRAAVEGWHLGADLALLKVEGAGSAVKLTVPRYAEEAGARVGSLTLALGRPSGSVEAAWGIVRATGGAWQSQGGAQIDQWIDVDGSLPRGFPGGPLVGADGAVIGINSRWIAPGGSTVPIRTIRRLIAVLERGGQRRPGWLGTAIHPVELAEGGRGLMVMRVEADSPAAKAGIFQGDILLDIAGVRLEQPAALQGWLREGQAGAEVTVRLRRAGQDHAIPLTVGERPEPRQEQREAGQGGGHARHGCGSRGGCR